MAKKIIISFSAQPITSGAGWSYSLKSNGIRIPYNSGSIDCTINFRPIGTTANVNTVAVGADLTQTLNITLAHLNQYYANNVITYKIEENTIEVLINADVDILVSSSINANVDITFSEVEPNFMNLKYFLIYGDYRLEIQQKNYLGPSFEIFGSLSINKGSVATILEPIRGTGINLSLEANSALTFDEFSLADELSYKTELKKNGLIIFKGYIKPDGVQQSFVNNEWLVNIESVDGLGLLKDLSFVNQYGLPFTDRISMYQVIKGCLDRTGLSMPINTSVELTYDGFVGTNILKNTYVNSDRFIKAENDPVIMDCNDVLTSVLNIFSGVITQEDGKWYVYRPNDLLESGITTFINQDTDEEFNVNLSAVLGSQIDNFYPHHCDGNQQIEVKGAISAYRLNYEYGFPDGFILNKDLTHDESLNFPNWTVINPTYIINDPLNNQGLQMIPGNAPTFTLESDSYYVAEGTVLNFSATLFSAINQHVFSFQIKTSDGKSLNNLGVWTPNLTSGFFTKSGIQGVENETTYFNFKSEPVINDCTVQVVILRPAFSSSLYTNNTLTIVSSINVSAVIPEDAGKVGEFHTVSRKLPPSSITKENQTVFNGDGSNALIGTIYKEDILTQTTIWSRKGKNERYPILRISAEDDLRIQQSPIKVFSGNIFGQIPYLSVVKINNISGLFMFTEYNFDIQSNKLSGVLTQFYNTELGDIAYNFSFDYGNNTIKPTIKG